MKAERRHELKTNTLAEALAGMPERRWQHTGVTISIALGGVLIFLLVRYRMTANQTRLARAQDNLAVAREEIDEIRQETMMNVDPSQPLELARDIGSRVDSVLSEAGDSNPTLAAEALVARGDLDWIMAGISAATTQPIAGQQSSDELLKGAQSAYQQVVTNYPKQSLSVTTAQFGLAAIDENHHDWDGARKEYQAIIDDPQSGEVFQTQAKNMLASLSQVTQQPIIGAIVPATTQSASPLTITTQPFGPTR
jgi:hypothetical protein